MGVPLRELIFEHAGGIRHGHRFKAVIPRDSSVPVSEQHLDVRMDFESLQQAGSLWDRRGDRHGRNHLYGVGGAQPAAFLLA